VTDNSGISHDHFTQLCLNTDEMATDMGTVLDGTDAVRFGLIDELGSLSDALAALHRMIEASK
ncbi:MAG: peptidase S14, partial [Clostridia bacterium]|nr:peptidase S14 [Clostridia bacterium]